MEQYDIVVIGTGGGTKLVRPVADLGYKVCVVEKESLGGTCLNRGCIPSKMLIHAADVASQMNRSEKFSITWDKKSFNVDFKDLVSRVSNEIDIESQSIEPVYTSNPNITLIKGHASFTSSNIIKVNDRLITAPKIIIAVGAKAHIPASIEGLASTPYITYREALRLTTQPKKLIVIGAGYIAAELGYFFGALGTEVHFIIRSEMLRNEDAEIRDDFIKAFSQKFHLHYGKPIKASHDGNLFTISYESDNKVISLHADQCLVATGVEPYTKGLGLENTSIKTNSKGFIQTNSYLKTTQDNVWALGDCIGNYLFRHSANFEGEYLFKSLYIDNKLKPIEYPPIPHAVFTHPQIAGVGYTEEELNNQEIPYYKGVNSYKQSAMGMALRSEHGLVKLLFEKNSNKLIGAHITGDEASNMVHMLIAYINMNATLDDILKTVYIHPAINEIIRNAARKAKASIIKNA